MNQATPIDIKEFTHEELTAWLAERKIPSYRAAQIFRWIYLRQVDAFEEMTDLGKDLRSLLATHFRIDRLEKREVEVSRDGTRKYLFKLGDGSFLESVLIPERDHYTLCVSSQVGCAMGCRFCLTARGGLVRNLTRGEILAQVRDIAKEVDAEKRLTNIVFMGMGEPLANFSNLLSAIRILTDGEGGLNFSTRRVTVSTSGLVPGIRELGKGSEVNLAVSLNAADNETRDRLMPINRKYPIEELIKACAEYPLRHRRRITFEYILIKGMNDSPEDARKLAALLRPVRAKINLIPFNPHAGCAYERTEESAAARFQRILIERHYTAVMRYSKGDDISAACGQLRANAFDPDA